MRRYAVAFVSMALGGLITAVEIRFGWKHLPPGAMGQAGPLTFQDQRLILDACITCYAVAYAVGKLIYRLTRAKEDLADLQAWSRGHMRLLNTMGGVWLIISNAQAGTVRPSLFVGVLLLAISLREWWCAVRNRRRARSRQANHHSP